MPRLLYDKLRHESAHTYPAGFLTGGVPWDFPPPKIYVIIAYTWSKTAVERQYTDTGAITTVDNAWSPNPTRINLRALTFSKKILGGGPPDPPLYGHVLRTPTVYHSQSPPLPPQNKFLYETLPCMASQKPTVMVVLATVFLLIEEEEVHKVEVTEENEKLKEEEEEE